MNEIGGNSVICDKCGSTLPQDAKFCGSCGAKTLSDSFENSAPNPAPPPPSYAAPAATATRQNVAPPPPSYTAPPYSTSSDPLSIKEYVIMFLLMCVPILNIVLLIMWSFGNTVVNVNKRNFARAALIFCAISIVVSLIFGSVIFRALFSIFGARYYY